MQSDERMGTNEIRKDPCEDIRKERESYDKITATKNRGIFFVTVVNFWWRFYGIGATHYQVLVKMVS
jgi:hypothetical protein